MKPRNRKLAALEKTIRRLTRAAMEPDGIDRVKAEIGEFTFRSPSEVHIMQGIADAMALKEGIRMLVVEPPIEGMEPGLIPVPF